MKMVLYVLMNWRKRDHTGDNSDFCYVCKQRDRFYSADQRNRCIAREHGILFHTDAVQAFCQVPIDVEECNIDMLSSSGHKINGPKESASFISVRALRSDPLYYGGAQERKRRAGTENVPGIVGYGAAAERAMKT